MIDVVFSEVLMNDVSAVAMKTHDVFVGDWKIVDVFLVEMKTVGDDVVVRRKLVFFSVETRTVFCAWVRVIVVGFAVEMTGSDVFDVVAKMVIDVFEGLMMVIDVFEGVMMVSDVVLVVKSSFVCASVDWRIFSYVEEVIQILAVFEVDCLIDVDVS